MALARCPSRGGELFHSYMVNSRPKRGLDPAAEIAPRDRTVYAPSNRRRLIPTLGQDDGGLMAEIAKVLVTVKTYPSPSDKYGETVCVAGARLDGDGPQWVRLYPMKFRLVDYEQQFTKYEILEVPVTRHGSADPRSESMRPDQTRMRSIRKVSTARNWAERRELVRPLIGATTTCELIAANRAVDSSQSAPSLGLVKVTDVEVKVSDGEPWEPNQLAKVMKAAQPDLFNPDGFRELQPAPFRVTVKYRCASSGCEGHRPSLLDWETGQAGRKWLRENGPSRAKQMLQDKYETLFGDNIDTHLFVGNLHQHRTSFSALGIWSPKIEHRVPSGDTLFD